MGGTRGRVAGTEKVITLVLGGARSGKSELAERIAASRPPPVRYLATAVVGEDADFAARVERHRQRRPASWVTTEVGADLAQILHSSNGTVLVDSLGTWVAARPDFEVDGPALCRALEQRSGDTIIVSEEVGLGVHPSTGAGGRFRDELGELNRAVADAADEVLLVIAGRALRLEAWT
jgi:adenosyl cobinamide kinase/adenosyl cobinamide phosphate guanylyltransferase